MRNNIKQLVISLICFICASLFGEYTLFSGFYELSFSETYPELLDFNLFVIILVSVIASTFFLGYSIKKCCGKVNTNEED